MLAAQMYILFDYISVCLASFVRIIVFLVITAVLKMEAICSLDMLITLS